MSASQVAAKVARLGWYLRRMRTMSPAELAWRTRRAIPRLPAVVGDVEGIRGADLDWDTMYQQFRSGAGPRAVLLDRQRAREFAAVAADTAAAVIAAADDARAGHFTFFGYPTAELGSRIDWHRDPISDVVWPAVRSSAINHRSAAGDPKWIWELNRLQHLPLLVEAALLTGDDGYAEAAVEQLESWIDQNPPGVGIAWRGAFEAGIRAISVAVAVGGLRDSPLLDQRRYRTFVTMLNESAVRCWQDRSLFSSANNHLVGELAGLATIMLFHPELPKSVQRRTLAVDALAAEASRQILPDGAGAEQALAYQVFTAELFLLVAGLLRRTGVPVPEALDAALLRSAGYLDAVMGPDDPTPRYGDDDEGFALRLGSEPLRDPRAHCNAVYAVIRDGAAGSSPDPLGGWLANGWTRASASDRRRSDPPRSLHAPNGGLVVLRTPTRGLTMDVGPLGYLATAAHGHADALAVTLSVDGRDVVGDPGPGSYYGHPEWRSVFRGTRAHGTVCVDDVDQSVAGGPFLWTEHARVRVRRVDLAAGLVEAEHDGYLRLANPVRHVRWLIAPPGENTVVVVDLIEATGEHSAVVSWPLAPDLDVRCDATRHHARRAGQPLLSLTYAATSPVELVEVRGDEDSNLGWWSTRLESRRPAWLVGVRSALRGPAVLVTALEPGGAAAVTDLAVHLSAGQIVVTWREDGRSREVTVERPERAPG